MGDLSTERFQTGNHVVLYASGLGAVRIFGTGIVGKRLPEATSSDFSVNTGARHLHTVGSAEPQDIVDGAHTYEVTLAELRLRSSDDQDLINAGPVDIVGVDQYSGGRVRAARNCRLQGARVNVPANNPVAKNLTFLAMSIT